jgi:PIN domain nuclease of toxin-antitoxin system
MTRFLLDTHIWLWLQASPDRIPRDLMGSLQNEDNELLLSAVSSWEIYIKYSIGNLSLPEAPRTYIPNRMHLSGTTGLAIEHSHTLAVAELPRLHGDPFDRLLVAQARELQLRLVTADPLIAAYEVDTEFVPT